jgi:hypothetical protein
LRRRQRTQPVGADRPAAPDAGLVAAVCDALQRGVEIGEAFPRLLEVCAQLRALEADGRPFGIVLVIEIRVLRRFDDGGEVALEVGNPRRDPGPLGLEAFAGLVSESELRAIGFEHQVLVLGVVLDELPHQRADRAHGEPPRPHVVEGRPHELAREPVAPEPFVHLRVDEHHHVTVLVVVGEPGELVVEADLETMQVLVVRHRRRHAFGVARRPDDNEIARVRICNFVVTAQ